MSVRYLVSVEPGADPAAIEAGLYDAGAQTVTPPRPELPDVFVATVDESLADYAGRAQSIAGVRVAEPDAWVGFGGGEDGDLEMGSVEVFGEDAALGDDAGGGGDARPA